MPISIIFIHTGNSYYLKYSLAQAKSSNANSAVYLLGDESNRRFPFVQHHDINKFSTNANVFQNLYKHFSQHSHAFELFCFKRWFILEEFINKHGIDSPFIYLDSDAMLYEDLETLVMFLDQFDFTVTSVRGPQYLFFKNSDILRDFTTFIKETYSDGPSLQELENIYHEYSNGPSFAGGGICDMTLLEKFRNTSAYKCHDLNTIVDDAIFDNSVCNSEHFEMNKRLNIKKFHWSNKIPFGFHLDLKKRIKFNAVHFQGVAKKYIPCYYRGYHFFPQSLLENYVLLDLAQRVKQSIKRYSVNAKSNARTL